MLGLNVFSLLVFIAVNIIAAEISRKCEDKRNHILRLICLFLLTFNVCRYALSPFIGRGVKVPVEFSSVAYFIAPLFMLTRIRKLQGWAIYSGLMAGFFYYTAMIVSGGKIYGAYPPYETYISLCCHGTLYLLGAIGIKTRKPEASDGLILPLGVGLVALNAYLLRPIADVGARLLIYELMDGIFIKKLLPSSLRNNILPAYYIVISALVLLSVILFHRLNTVAYKKAEDSVKKSGPVKAAVRNAA
jgi:hypothetical protein